VDDEGVVVEGAGAEDETGEVKGPRADDNIAEDDGAGVDNEGGQHEGGPKFNAHLSWSLRSSISSSS